MADISGIKIPDSKIAREAPSNDTTREARLANQAGALKS